MYFVDISLEKLADKTQCSALQQLPTTFYLETENVDKLIQAGDSLLKRSPDFTRFIAGLER